MKNHPFIQELLGMLQQHPVPASQGKELSKGNFRLKADFVSGSGVFYLGHFRVTKIGESPWFVFSQQKGAWFTLSLTEADLLDRRIQSYNNDQTSMEQAIEVAREAARRLGYDLDKMGLESDEANSAWNGYRSYLEKRPMHESTKRRLGDLTSKLSNRKYRAIYFLPQNNLSQGDDLFVFVDAKTGDVLGVLTGSQLSP